MKYIVYRNKLPSKTQKSLINVFDKLKSRFVYQILINVL